MQENVFSVLQLTPIHPRDLWKKESLRLSQTKLVSRCRLLYFPLEEEKNCVYQHNQQQHI